MKHGLNTELAILFSVLNLCFIRGYALFGFGF